MKYTEDKHILLIYYNSEGGCTIIDFECLECADFNGIYKEIAETLGVEIAIKFYTHFKGLQVTFPVRLLSKEYVLKQLENEYDGSNIKLLARKYAYSERWIRTMLGQNTIIESRRGER